jgi:glycosyltransferase involved in cell wall biosynthesis
MKVLFSVDPEIEVPPKFYGGIERVVDGLIREFRRCGHEVGLVAHRASTALVHAFYPWPSLSSLGLGSGVRNTVALVRAVSDFGPDVIHSFSRLGYLLPLLPFPVGKVMSYQRHTGGRQIRVAARLGGRSIAFTGCSDFIATQGRSAGGGWFGIPNFIDPARFVFQSSVTAEAPLVFLSRIERIKGTHTAIAMAKLAGRRLIIAGNRSEEGEHADYWTTEVAPHLGKDGIEYVGPVDDEQKNALLGSAAAMVVPIEWHEPFGIVFAEALACGTPVISSPMGALPEIVHSGRHGFLVNSVEEGVRAIQALPDIVRFECRARVEELFTVEKVAEQYMAVYRGLVSL